ncbi:MAG: hypothetical protein ACO39U_00375 [Bacteroidia bacterium]
MLPIGRLNDFWMKWNWNVPFEPEFRARIGRYTLYAAISGFMVHLGLIGLKTLFPDWISSNFLAHPINAIYTPFSILLFFESYLLIYYLRQSTTFYIGKQYEIIALILIRGIFKDMTHLDLQAGSFQTANNLELARDLGAVMLVFGMIFVFYKISGIQQGLKGIKAMDEDTIGPNLRRFIRAKKILSLLLLLVFAFLSIQSLVQWLAESSKDVIQGVSSGNTIDANAIFFDHFFTVLILSDVFILLFSLLYTEEFPTIIRNSSFVISTILLKLSFSAEGGMVQLFILTGVGFGVAMLYLANIYEKLKTQDP